MLKFRVCVEFKSGFCCPTCIENVNECFMVILAPNWVSAKRMCNSMFNGSTDVLNWSICCIDENVKNSDDFPFYYDRNYFGYDCDDDYISNLVNIIEN